MVGTFSCRFSNSQTPIPSHLTLAGALWATGGPPPYLESTRRPCAASSMKTRTDEGFLLELLDALGSDIVMDETVGCPMDTGVGPAPGTASSRCLLAVGRQADIRNLAVASVSKPLPHCGGSAPIIVCIVDREAIERTLDRRVEKKDPVARSVAIPCSAWLTSPRPRHDAEAL